MYEGIVNTMVSVDTAECIAAHHAGICFGRSFQRIGFDHGAYLAQFDKVKRVLRFATIARSIKLLWNLLNRAANTGFGLRERVV